MAELNVCIDVLYNYLSGCVPWIPFVAHHLFVTFPVVTEQHEFCFYAVWLVLSARTSRFAAKMYQILENLACVHISFFLVSITVE